MVEMGSVAPTIEVRDVTKKFGDFTAVGDLSFEVYPGRIFGFLGPNGAGKTTTIRMLVGITFPDSGEVRLFGEPVSSRTQDRIGYIPEERGLYKKLKVVDQLRYFGALKGITGREAERRIDFWLERMGLADWKRKKTTDLSKGMQQKLQFIAAVLHDPDILILDEPFSGLDPVNVEFMIEVLSEFQTDEKTVIFSTHLMETAERLCHDILLINRSQKVVSGSLREVKASYGANFVALRGSGVAEILRRSELVAKVVEFADEMEVHLKDGSSHTELLRELLENGADITKFELTEPSLNDIFIAAVGGSGTDAERAGGAEN